MDNDFRTGFEKVAGIGKSIANTAKRVGKHLSKNRVEYGVGVGTAGAIGAMGAGSGHLSDVSRKLEASKHGKTPERKSWVQKNPKKSGALSIGIAPAMSAYYERKKLNRDNKKTRAVKDQHPYASDLLGQ